MFKRELSFLIACLILFSLSCSDDDNPVTPEGIVGSGDIIQMSLTLPEFHSIRNEIVATIAIASGDEQTVSMDVDNNIYEYITTTVSNGELIISKDPDVIFSEYDLTLNITMTDLKKLTNDGVASIASTNTFGVDSVWLYLNGVGTIYLDLQADYLKTIMAGPSSVSLIGSATNHVLTNSSVGSVYSFNFEKDTTVVTLTGIGDASVYVNDYLRATITGIGSVYYRGDATVEATITGTGGIEKDN